MLLLMKRGEILRLLAHVGPTATCGTNRYQACETLRDIAQSA
jgi:hypothetical protein